MCKVMLNEYFVQDVDVCTKLMKSFGNMSCFIPLDPMDPSVLDKLHV
jgi:hypothetical protein